MREVCTMAYADALRGYISHLREEKGTSQRELAEAMGIARNTYIAWETGETKDLKAPLLIRALRFLSVPLEHLEELVDAETEEEGRALANRWLQFTPEQQAQANRIAVKLDRVIELGEQDPERLIQIVNRLRADSQNDSALLDMIIGYLDGRRSRNS